MKELTVSFALTEEEKILYDDYAGKDNRNLKDISRKEYLYIISSFLRERNCRMLDATPLDADAYHQNMLCRVHDNSLSEYTVNMRLRVCSDFYAWLYENGAVKTNPFSFIELSVLDDRPFTDKIPTVEDIDSALAAAKEMGESTYLSLCLVVRMALTDSDLRNIKTSNVVEFEGTVALHFVDAKGKQKEAHRYVVVPEDLKEAVLRYKEGCTTEYLFPSNRGTQYSVKGLETRNEKLMRAAGLKGKFSLKDFRTRAILQMLNDGADEKDVCCYANITMKRVHSYQDSHILKGKMLACCPANVSRLRIITE